MNDGPTTSKRAHEPSLAVLWREFTHNFRTDDDCVSELCKWALKANVIRCGYCGSRRFDLVRGARKARCLACNKRSWLTAGTFFHRIRRARAWLAAIWLMERGVSLNSSEFHRLVGIAYSSALQIFKKVTFVIANQMDENTIELPSALFTPVICKRSRETPSREHPSAEQHAFEKSFLGDGEAANTLPETAVEEIVDCSRLGAAERQVYNLLSSEPVQFDDLCARTGIAAGDLSASLVMLELDGLVTRMEGARYARPAAKLSAIGIPHAPSSPARIGGIAEQSAAEAAEVVVSFIRNIYKGISRKYLQNYAAVHWCHSDQRRWGPGKLLRACLTADQVTADFIRDYVTPLMVRCDPSR